MSSINPYSNPEVHGLTLVTYGNDPQAAHGYNMFVVWTDGLKLYYAEDSGCLCGDPFEVHAISDSLTLLEVNLNTGTPDEVIAAAGRWAAAGSNKDSEVAWLKQVFMINARVRAWMPQSL